MSAFLPQDRARALAAARALPERCEGAALFADVSGFTPLAQALAADLGSRRGAETLIGQLDRVYTALIGPVDRAGGAVIGFSGDAITCWFGGDDGSIAAACALAMQTVMDTVGEVRLAPDRALPLAVKIAVAAGAARRFAVGRPGIQRLDVVAGRPLERVAAGEKLARQREVVVAPEVAARLARTAGAIVEWRDDPAHGRFGVLAPDARLAPADKAAPPPDVPDDLVREWLLPAVYERARAGDSGIGAELRQAVSLFIGFGGIDYEFDAAGAALDGFVCRAQDVLQRYGGALVDLTVGDKGSYAYAVFGGLVAHEDDAARAVAAAWELAAPDAAGGGLPVRVGISRGTTWAGTFGAPSRRTFGVIGGDVAVAARLMERADAGQVLVTRRVADSARTHRFTPLGDVALKGRSEPVAVYAAAGPARRESLAERLATRGLPPMVGRDAERTRLAERVALLQTAGTGGLAVIEGEAGIGKSRLVAALHEDATALGLPPLLGAAFAMEQNTPYHAWRGVVGEILGGRDGAVTAESALRALADDPWLSERAPLFNAVLPLGLSDTALTSQLLGQVRADNTVDALVRLLAREGARRGGLVVVLEDTHWMDSSSWTVAVAARQRLERMLLVLVSRPLPADAPPEFITLRGTNALVVTLDRLAPEQALALVCARLGVRALPPEIGALIRAKAEGHPFFSEELAYALRDAGVITIEGDACLLTGDWRELDLPDTVEGVITSRIDGLTRSQQLALKVASVIGRSFPVRTLRALYPPAAEADTLAADLAALERLALTQQERAGPDAAYAFTHAITQDVVYQSLPFAQRRALHRAAGEWFELAHGAALDGIYPLLAHHWSRAAAGGDDPTVAGRAVDYLDRAGSQAVARYANKEGLALLADAAALERRAALPADAPRRARRASDMGFASLAIGRLDDTRRHGLEALALLGQAVPQTPGRWRRAILAELARWLWHRASPAALWRAPPRRHADLVLAIRTWMDVGEAMVQVKDGIGAMVSGLKVQNLTDAVGEAADLPRVYAAGAYLAALFPVHPVAQWYSRRARAFADHPDRLASMPYMWFVSGSYDIGRGAWPLVEHAYARALEASDRLGDRRQRGNALWGWAVERYYRADFAGCAGYAERLHRDAADYGDLQAVARALVWQAAARLRQAPGGHETEVLALLEEAQRVLAGNPVRTEDGIRAGLLALARWRQGERELAAAAADEAATIIGADPPTMGSMIEGYAGAAEITLELWAAALAAGAAAGELASWRDRARQRVMALRGFARVWRTGAPRAWLCQGAYDWHAGRHGRAVRAWRRGAAAAAALDMPYEEGRAHAALARYPDGTTDAAHAARATALFESVGARWDAAQVAGPTAGAVRAP